MRRSSGSLLCCGLDPDGFASATEAEQRCLEIVDATSEFVCAFKPNLAFFEQMGSAGYAILERLRTRIPHDRILILDAKRGDVGNTAAAYTRALFDVLGADCVTVNPLLGRDSVLPFLQREDRGAFLDRAEQQSRRRRPARRTSRVGNAGERAHR